MSAGRKRAAGHSESASPPHDAPGSWDGVAVLVDRQGHYLDTFLGHLKRDAYLALVDRWRPVEPPRRMLKTDLFEEAVGPDSPIPQLTARFGRWIGMDASVAAVRLALRRNPEQRVMGVVADARALPFAAGSFDLVLSPSTLDHFPDADDLGRSLVQIARTLAPAAHLVITLDNRQNIGDPLLRVTRRLGLVPYYLGRSYSAAELRRELGAAGLEVRETDAIVHHPRMFAVAFVTLARRIRWRPVVRLVQWALLSFQRCGSTRLRYFTGCFVAALASPPGGPGSGGPRSLDVCGNIETGSP